MPPAATKSKYGKNLQVLHFDPAPPPGACVVSEVWGTHRWNLQSKFGYFIISQTLIIALCLKAGRNYGQTNGQTDKRTDKQTDDPITRCPRRTFQTGGIKSEGQGHRERSQFRRSQQGLFPCKVSRLYWLMWPRTNLNAEVNQNVDRRTDGQTDRGISSFHKPEFLCNPANEEFMIFWTEGEDLNYCQNVQILFYQLNFTPNKICYWIIDFPCKTGHVFCETQMLPPPPPPPGNWNVTE